MSTRQASFPDKLCVLCAYANHPLHVIISYALTRTDAAAVESAAAEADEKSVYVGQVDYEATPEELQAHFQDCGLINRITILCDKHTGHPKGYAYIEFASKDGAATAIAMNDSVLRGRKLKVTPKRQNLPGLGAAASYRGRGTRGRGRGAPRGRGEHV